MKLVRRIIAISGTLFITSSSFGLMWQDYDYVGTFLGEGQSYNGFFDLTSGSNGYDAGRHEISQASVGFSFSDGYRSGDSGREWVDVWLDTTKIWDDREVDGTHRYGFDWIWSGLNGTLLGDLQDGVMSYTIKLENKPDGYYNDVWFKEAKLKAWGSERPEGHRVPDSGSSIVILLMGLLGVFYLRQRVVK